MSDFTAERSSPCASTLTPDAPADTAATITSPSTEALTNPADAATPSPAPASNSAHSQDNPSPLELASLRTDSTDIQVAASEPEEDPEDRALELRKENAHSLAETLLIALNIPYDDRSEEAKPIHATIEPPVTAAKVAAQIAQVSNALLAGTLDPEKAKPVLYALQTMLTAIRVHAIEQKAQRTIEPEPRARRSAPKCKTSKPRRTASSRSPRNRKSH